MYDLVRPSLLFLYNSRRAQTEEAGHQVTASTRDMSTGSDYAIPSVKMLFYLTMQPRSGQN